MYLECHIKGPKSFNGLSRKLKGCMKFQVCFKEVSRMFQ